MRRSRYMLVTFAVAVAIVALFTTFVYYRPTLTVSVTRKPVRVGGRAYQLLLAGAPLGEIQAELKASGKRVDEHSWMETSLLSEAVLQRRRDVAVWLLGQGADPNGIHPSTAPLGYAIWNRDRDMVKLLLNHGADPLLDLGGGLTPLRVADDLGCDDIGDIIQQHIRAPSPSKNPGCQGRTSN